jgi:hypothetical protein
LRIFFSRTKSFIDIDRLSLKAIEYFDPLKREVKDKLSNEELLIGVKTYMIPAKNLEGGERSLKKIYGGGGSKNIQKMLFFWPNFPIFGPKFLLGGVKA